ncbi:unnamed protein product [Parnassius apollo]|uniref:(apollo) hypothetical protein n=1 Tax=Parnassius apollo TaxID=110799 RepID=A0A8S3X4W3_PARAO|nr:unnamed protein product [Parnassius apollo]
MSVRKTMWNPRNNPVPQVFIEVLLNEEEAIEYMKRLGNKMTGMYLSWGDLSELLVEPAEVSGSPAPAPVAAPVAAPEAVPGPAPRRVERSPAPAPAAAPVAAPEAVPGPAPRRVEGSPALAPAAAPVAAPEAVPGPAPRRVEASIQIIEGIKNIAIYRQLLETVYCRILLLNRRKPGELQRITLHDYLQSDNNASDKYDEC